MTRLQFFSMLAGCFSLKAQQPTFGELSGGTNVITAIPAVTWDAPAIERTYRNGECPVCGTMAEAFRPKHSPWCSDAVYDNLETGERSNGCAPELLPKETIVRCRNCNNAFWQDAETTK